METTLGYALEGAVICSGHFAILQPFSLLPVPLMQTCFNIQSIYCLEYLYGLYDRITFEQRKAPLISALGMETSITSIVAFLVMVLIMGVTAQTPQGAKKLKKRIPHEFRFRQLTNSWSFCTHGFFICSRCCCLLLRKT